MQVVSIKSYNLWQENKRQKNPFIVIKEKFQVCIKFPYSWKVNTFNLHLYFSAFNLTVFTT